MAIAKAIEERLKGRVGGNRMPDHPGKISGMVDAGDSRDLAAEKSGFRSGKTYEAAKLWSAPRRGWRCVMAFVMTG
ncbi:MAG TPA: hypothetical protein PKE37_00170 [Thiomonas arsenitoxydans]|uniref:hypothetical protein n=1 Tax=Thiomonas arsenitoxydans (strain DSM 22701 / CIP 110005 / 3As) TaxID=426114 RepID=UPI002C42E66D|nr:hypothetical protein [Thiomonas arsenitoxydans]HML80163.1 hypothetical protein [Thiomonas arsenitoxydans]